MRNQAVMLATSAKRQTGFAGQLRTAAATGRRQLQLPGGHTAYVAHYEKNGLVAMLYVSRPARSSMTAVQIENMAAGIRTGKTLFTHLKSSERNGTTVYSTLGQGQIHYFYRRGADVIWIAADPSVAREVVEYLLQRDL